MEKVATLMERILYEAKKVVVGQDHFLERVLVATLAQTIRGTFRRIQNDPTGATGRELAQGIASGRAQGGLDEQIRFFF